MGRARKVTGPYLDNMGVDMIEGGGKLFAGSRGRHIGPGHFGLLDLGQGVQKFSLHYEADLDRGGISVLDIRPLLWRDGWPVAGDNLTPGHYSIESVRTGTVLELAVQGFPVGGYRQRRPGGGSGPPPEPRPGPAIADQEAIQVGASWPAKTDVRLAPAMLQAQQKWTLTPVPNSGGTPGAPYFRISVTGTERSLTATTGGELSATPFNGATEQLWRIDQLTDGTYRISPKAIPGMTEPLALSAVGSSMPTLAKFDAASDRQRWLLEHRDESSPLRYHDRNRMAGLCRKRGAAGATPASPFVVGAQGSRAPRRRPRLHSSLAGARARRRAGKAHGIRGAGRAAVGTAAGPAGCATARRRAKSRWRARTSNGTRSTRSTTT